MITEAQVEAAREWLERYQALKEERDLLQQRIVEAKSTRAVAAYSAVLYRSEGTTSDPVSRAVQAGIRAEQEYADRAMECLLSMHEICRTIDALDYPAQRQALELAFVHGLTNREAADRAGCSIRAFQARKKAGIQTVAATRF